MSKQIEKPKAPVVPAPAPTPIPNKMIEQGNQIRTKRIQVINLQSDIFLLIEAKSIIAGEIELKKQEVAKLEAKIGEQQRILAGERKAVRQLNAEFETAYPAVTVEKKDGENGN